MSIYTGKAGYNSSRLWQERSKLALKERGQLYTYDTRLDSDDQILRWLLGYFDQHLKLYSILEIGAGFGRWASGLQQYYSSFTGVDVVPERVEHARQLRKNIPNATFELVTGQWDLKKTFDVVLSVTVIQHLLMPQAIAVLKAIERHLAPDGRALLAEWMIFDCTLAEAEKMYSKSSTPSHMVPKPLADLKCAVPGLEWSGSAGKFILRKRR